MNDAWVFILTLAAIFIVARLLLGDKTTGGG